MKRICLIGVSALVSLCTAEAVLRLFPVINNSNINAVAWNHWSDATNSGLVFQAQGAFNKAYIQDGEIGYIKPDVFKHIDKEDNPNRQAKYSVLILGDSVSELGSYVDELRARLENKFGSDVTVINAGTVGYDTQMEYALLQKMLARYTPDIVIVQFNINDFDGTPIIMRQADGTWFAFDRQFPASYIHPQLFARSEVYKLLVTSILKYRRTNIDHATVVRTPLQKMVNLLGSRNIPYRIVYFPLFAEREWKHKTHAMFTSVVQDIGIERNVLDLTDVYEQFPNAQVSVDETHPNVFGDRLAADAIFAAIVSWIPQTVR